LPDQPERFATSAAVCPAAVGEDAGSRSYAKTKILGAMKEAKSGNLHYIFLQAYVNEPIISMPKLLENVPEKSC
jgi:hypothetical protein